ncbi:DUF4446 family protein [Paenibacillus sp. GD4]|uniref:DUF4446 family protein n=1 Tax=Paenibacillus sp. GD4 TaxID=3068890 RepID=UPI002796D8AA|nr:DUF4446 family protein [Paenibacillus sp. GD4]MDQ1911177.1 DUF4446 family protein [Paenibacillus sp. GD4]
MGETLSGLPVEVVLFFAGIVTLLFLIVVISLWVKMNKLRKSYQKMLNGSGSLDVEQVLIDLQNRCNDQSKRMDLQEQTILAMQQRMQKMKSNIAIQRYNAFAESGSDLSFSLALVDDEMDGLILSGIHNRDHTFVYAKPVEQGQSKYTLSPEEKEVLTRSLQKKQ